MNVIALLVLAQVSSPFPGITLVRHSRSAMTITNLCAPGVSLRATRFAERQATPQQWGQAVGVQVAINADFFEFPGWSYILVRARGAGEDWPPSAQRLEQPSSYWKFGVGIADIEPSSLVQPGPLVTDVVGAYDPLIADGRVVSFAGQPFMQASYRRSAIGLSRDKRTLYFYASDAPVNGDAMANEMLQMAAEAGAPAIDLATNQDGGGSTQLYVQGQGQIITSGRPVATHLGIFASGSGPAWSCNNPPPRGVVDAVSCDGVSGWAQDPSAPTAPIDVHVYYGGGPGSGAPGIPTRADRWRDDLCGPLGSCDHAFVARAPLSMFDGRPHEVHAYGIDTTGGFNPELAQSPATLTCAVSPPRGRLRHVATWDSFLAWKLDLAWDVQPVSDAWLAAAPRGDDWPEVPQLVKVGGAVFAVEHGVRRAVEWAVSAGPAAGASTLPEGPPLSPRPWLVKGSDLAIYVVDALEPAVAAPVRALAPQVAPAGTHEDTDASDDLNVIGSCSHAPALLPLLALLLARRRRGLRTPA